MAKQLSNTQQTTRRRPPPRTPEVQENQMIAAAMDLAERQLRDGSASSQVITHFLKLGSTKDKIEKEILERQKDLITAKTEALKGQKRMEDLLADAMQAFSTYRPKDEGIDYD